MRRLGKQQEGLFDGPGIRHIKASSGKSGQSVFQENLLDRIWGYDYFGSENIVNTHIKNIRRKLGVDYIETIRGVGYKIDKEH